MEVKVVLKFTYGIVPIVAGLDKFLNLLADWGQYAEGLSGMLPMEIGTFMMIVGVIEIVAGFLVLAKPKTGALVVTAWLIAIALVLISSGKFLDVAVRDLVMAVGSYSLFKLS